MDIKRGLVVVPSSEESCGACSVLSLVAQAIRNAIRANRFAQIIRN